MVKELFERFFRLLFLPKSQVENWIELCEGKHVQQVAYSTYHKALTQICYGCKTIRTSLKEKDVKCQE